MVRVGTGYPVRGTVATGPQKSVRIGEIMADEIPGDLLITSTGTHSYVALQRSEAITTFITRGIWNYGDIEIIQVEGLRPREAVHLEDPDLEVPARAQRRVVEGRAAVSLAEPDVLVHPDRLAVTVEHKNYIIDTF